MPDNLHILLLRGVNVAGANRLPMAEFRTMLESMGGTSVRTYIQSGNAVLRSALAGPALAEAVASGIEKDFGFRPALVHVLDRATLDRVIAGNPFSADDLPLDRLHIFFLARPAPETDLSALRGLAAPDEDFCLTGAAFYLKTPSGIGRSGLAEKLPRYLKAAMTSRNLRSVLAIRDLAAQVEGGAG
ncbi:MAG: DUF1697 domain-containing protein [Paracoccaceae bacterium]